MRSAIVLFILCLITACGGSYDNRPGPVDSQPTCTSYVLNDGLTGSAAVSILSGDVERRCGGQYRCLASVGEVAGCRVELAYSAKLKHPIGAYVDTWSGKISLSDRVEVQGTLTNLEPRERLRMCGFNATFYYVYISMSVGAEVADVVFENPPNLCAS